MESKVKRQRTCVGCAAKSSKQDFMRIVRTGAGVSFDPTGRVAGRGAYVCSAECFENAYKSRKLQRALKTNIDQQTAESIAAALASIDAQ